MSNYINDTNRTPKNKVFAGVILLAVGGMLLIRQFNFFLFPHWLFSWPILLIIWGLYYGAKHNFRKPFWFILVIIGVGNLLDDIIPNFDVSDIMWPVMLIAFGIWIIMRKRNEPVVPNSDYWDKKYKANPTGIEIPTATTFTAEGQPIPPSEPIGSVPPPTQDDYLNATAIFGGVNKTILSKNFQGGDITNVFGGTELDFTQADIHGRVTIDITQMFGGTKLIVPANWHVVPDLAAVFAGVDDKRIKVQRSTTDKVLVLKGVSMFAGIDIRSY